MNYLDLKTNCVTMLSQEEIHCIVCYYFFQYTTVKLTSVLKSAVVNSLLIHR